MNDVLKHNGELVNVNGYNIHIYRQGNLNNPKILLMSGSGTVGTFCSKYNNEYLRSCYKGS